VIGPYNWQFLYCVVPFSRDWNHRPHQTWLGIVESDLALLNICLVATYHWSQNDKHREQAVTRWCW